MRKYPKGQILLYEGEKTDSVFQIKSGYVKVYDINSQGNEKLMMILGPSDIFPLIWTFRGSESIHYFYETFSDSEVSVVPRTYLISDIKSSHQTTIALLEYFVDRSKDLMNRIDCIGATSAKHKVAQSLSYLAEAHGVKITKGTYRIKIPMTHQAIANMAGITRETASIQLKSLEEEKLYTSSDDQSIVHLDRIKNFLEA